MRCIVRLATSVLLLAGAACSAGTEAGPAGSGVLSVVTTTTQLTDFAREVGGSRARVYGVLKANVDPHDYEPTPADLDALAAADVIVKNGVDLEGWFDDTIRSASPKGRIVDASRGIPIRRGEGGAGDPHIWHNPQNAVTMVTSLAGALEEAAPEAAAEIRSNLATYTAKLAAADTSIRERVGRLANKRLVTNHDAFGYYIDHYGLDFVGSIIPSFDTSAELSAAQIADIVAKIRSTGTRAVFSESSLPPRTAEAIGREAGVRVVAGEDALYGDSLGPPGSDGATYIDAIRHNTRTIVDNLR